MNVLFSFTWFCHQVLYNSHIFLCQAAKCIISVAKSFHTCVNLSCSFVQAFGCNLAYFRHVWQFSTKNWSF